jgi:hypothetical protein
MSRISTLAVCCALAAGAGCSNAPTAPSRVVSTTPIAAASNTADSSTATASPTRFGSRTPGVVFVTSQGLYYDTFVVKDPLPMHGPFQLITAGATEFGPGQPGYLGGRWWEDLNGDGIQDAADHYFLCPLLPPGRETP